MSLVTPVYELLYIILYYNIYYIHGCRARSIRDIHLVSSDIFPKTSAARQAQTTQIGIIFFPETEQTSSFDYSAVVAGKPFIRFVSAVLPVGMYIAREGISMPSFCDCVGVDGCMLCCQAGFSLLYVQRLFASLPAQSHSMVLVDSIKGRLDFPSDDHNMNCPCCWCPQLSLCTSPGEDNGGFGRA